MRRLRNAFRRLRRRAGRVPPLREFVYLDEVSVYSLLASRQGAITRELTETESASLQEEVSSRVGVAAGVKSEVGSRLGSTRASSTQVVRKSIIQSSFKELVESESKHLVLPRPDPKHAAPTLKNIDALRSFADSKRAQPWLIDARTLTRGRLLEVDVELEAAAIFAANTALSSMLQIMDENPELFGHEMEGIAAGNMANRIFERLLAGLVPLRATAADYQVLRLDERDWLVHRRLTEALPFASELNRSPLYVVGVAERDLFWKDIRRVLFSHAQFTMMCRIARNGLHDSWTPVKLVDVFKEVIPQVAQDLDAVPHEFLAGMRTGAATVVAERATADERLHEALRIYAVAFATEHGKQPIEVRDLLLGLNVPDAEDIRAADARRAVFEPLTERLRDQLCVDGDRMLEARLRHEALELAGLGFDASDTSGDEVLTETTSADIGRYLDAEMVAIYW